MVGVNEAKRSERKDHFLLFSETSNFLFPKNGFFIKKQTCMKKVTLLGSYRGNGFTFVSLTVSPILVGCDFCLAIYVLLFPVFLEFLYVRFSGILFVLQLLLFSQLE
jgi:hypothetical protein